MTPMTINQCAKYAKEKDPNTPITASALRRLVASGAIRSCKVGVKNIITLENVEEYFCGMSAKNVSEPVHTTSTIRRLPERMV